MKKLHYKKKRKICVISTNRADYGHLKNLIDQIELNSKLELQFVVSGSHLNKRYGYTIKEIIKDNIPIKDRIKLHATGISESDKILKNNSKALIKFSKCFSRLKPDIILILGDRYELLPIAEVALFKNIAVAHLHGGEITEGVFDEQIRHSITKLSDIHFVANKIFEKNVEKLGENTDNIYCVGSPGCEKINEIKFKSKDELEKTLNFKFLEKNLLVTMHPENDRKKTKSMIANLFYVLKKLNKTKIFFTGTNSDLNSDIINYEINRFLKKNKNSVFFKSLGQKNYLSIMKVVDGVIGNSSSGFIEAPILKKPVVNIGDRQNGRPIDKNIISSKIQKHDIKESIKKIYFINFKKKLKEVKKYYFKVNTSDDIIKILIKKNIKNIKIKKFN